MGTDYKSALSGAVLSIGASGVDYSINNGYGDGFGRGFVKNLSDLKVS